MFGQEMTSTQHPQGRHTGRSGGQTHTHTHIHTHRAPVQFARGRYKQTFPFGADMGRGILATTTLDHCRVSKPHRVESTVVKISLFRLCACCSRTVPGDSCVPSWQGLDFVHERREVHASKSVAAAVSAGIRLSAPLYLTQQRENFAGIRLSAPLYLTQQRENFKKPAKRAEPCV